MANLFGKFGNRKKDKGDFTGTGKQDPGEGLIDEHEENALVNAEASNARKKGIFVIMAFLVIILMVGVLAKTIISGKQEKEAKQAADIQTKPADTPDFSSLPAIPVEQELPPVETAESASGEAIPLAMGDPTAPPPLQVAEAPKSEEPTPAQLRYSAPLMFGGSNGQNGSGGSVTPVSGSGGEDSHLGADPSVAGGAANSSGGALGGMLKPVITSPTRAGAFANRNLLMTKGTFIPCTLRTRLNTEVAGMVACVIPRDVYSSNGKVLLVERGSEVTGEFQQSAVMGASRIFVLWTRITTPKGVFISIDSPAADSLGGSGMTGKVNNHWFKRFGNALMFSFIQDAMATGFNRLSKDSDNSGNVVYTNTEDSSEEIVKEILKTTGNIKPTITKKQGETVGIYLARDLDFSTVYRLRPTQPYAVERGF